MARPPTGTFVDGRDVKVDDEYVTDDNAHDYHEPVEDVLHLSQAWRKWH